MYDMGKVANMSLILRVVVACRKKIEDNPLSIKHLAGVNFTLNFR